MSLHSLTPPRARRTDPETSHDAAASVAPTQRPSQAAVLYVLRTNGPITDTGLIGVYQLYARADVLPQQSESGIRTRRKELVTAGLVRAAGRVTLPSGRAAITWECVA